MASPTEDGDCTTLACISVSYEPDIELLSAQLARLPQAALKVVVDNGSTPMRLHALRDCIASMPRGVLVEIGSNIGLAAALNRGIETALAVDGQIVECLLLDQDTVPEQGACAALVSQFRALQLTDPQLGAVGPTLLDPATGLSHGFHVERGLRWSRVLPGAGDSRPVPCTTLNGSGTLMRRTVFEALGGLDARLFIDHIDTDWSFRLLAAGYRLYGLPACRFEHRMGEQGLRVWLGGWRVWPWRSPQRHYYLFRNTLWLLRRPHVGGVWKLWAPLKLGVTMLVFGLADPRRGEQMRAMLRGLRDGLSTRRR